MLEVQRATVVRWCQQGRFPGAHMRLGSRKLGWRIPLQLVVVLTEVGQSGQDSQRISE